MQRTIDHVGRLHLSSGTLTLRMSVGAGTGTFHFWLTGSVHRELLIGGPAMTETLQMEAIADAGEIGITETLARRLDPGCVGPRKEAAILLAAPPEVERRRAPGVGDVGELDIASAIPVATRAHVLLKKSEPEHRTITAAFIDMMDIDRLLEELGPQRLGEGLDARIRQIEEAALQFEVPFYESDVGKSSIKALLTAGAPSSTGHDEERMLRTLRTVMEQPGVVPMRIGVNTGKVFTGDFGPPYRRAYRVFGDAINTAARVMAKAEAGQILSTEIVLNRSKTVFDATPIPPFAAKGKAEPVRASIVGPVIGTREDDRAALPLTGRDAELRTMLDAVDSTRSGVGMLVEMIGEPGIGKTRLLDEVVARSPDMRILRTHGEEYESATPYFAMRAVLRSALDLDPAADTSEVVERLGLVVESIEPSLVPWIPLLGVLLGLDLPPTPETAALDDRFLRERLAEVTWTFLHRALPGPTMLAIDDSHHLDEPTRDLVLRLFRAGGNHRAMVVLAHQASGRLLDTNELEAERCLLVHLGPLSPEATLDLVEMATEDQPLRPDEAEMVVDRSAGNAMFLMELLDAVRAFGSVDSLPDSIEALIAGQIDRLAPADRMILRYAAVLGTRFDPALLEEAVRSDVELDADVWDRLSDVLSLDPDGSLRFENSLVRDAAYEGLPYRRRRVLHERVGETIEATAGESLEEEVATLALHFHEAQRWDKSWVYCRQAGDRAMRIYANLDAARFFSKALAAGRRLRGAHTGELAELYERRSDALYLLGDYDEADRALKAARRLVGSDPVAGAPLVVKQANMTNKTGRYRQSNARVTRALTALEGHRGRAASARRARLMVLYAETRYYQNHRTESIRWANAAAQEARRSDAKDALAQAYKLLDIAYKENGELEKAVYGDRALKLYDELGDYKSQANILNNQGILAHEFSDWDGSLALFKRSLEMFETIGDRANAVLAKSNIAEVLTEQGRLDEAEPLLREAIRVWRGQGADADVADARRELAKLLARRGEFDVAAELFDTALDEQIRTGRAGEELGTAVGMCELRVLRAEGAEATQAIDAAMKQANLIEGGSVFVPKLHRLRAWALLQAGDDKAAGAELAAAMADARSRGDRFECVLLADALIALRTKAGADIGDLAADRAADMGKLGIVMTPSFPAVARVAAAVS
jgi:predicted ATPase/class 3 adenylate cyclase